MSIAITGGSGFVGQALVAELAGRGHDLKLITRTNIESPVPHLSGCDTIIHLAALTHAGSTDEELFDAVNRRLPLRLADAAIAAGVARFVFVSSIAAIEGNSAPLRADMPHAPLTPFGRSKADAETGLLQKTGIDIVIARAPLVYGPNEKGNIGRLRRLGRSGLPLPFAGIHNKRTLVSLKNMSDGLAFLATAPAEDVAGKIFHITDPAPLALPELMRKVMAPDPVRQFWVPGTVLKAGIGLMAGRDTVNKLLGDSLVDGAALRAIGWTPPE